MYTLKTLIWKTDILIQDLGINYKQYKDDVKLIQEFLEDLSPNYNQKLRYDAELNKITINFIIAWY